MKWGLASALQIGGKEPDRLATLTNTELHYGPVSVWHL